MSNLLARRADGQPIATDEINRIGDSLDDRSRRTMQETITVTLMGLLGTALLFAFIWLIEAGSGMTTEAFTRIKDIVTIFLGPIGTLLSTVVGFYFGTKVATGGETAK